MGSTPPAESSYTNGSTPHDHDTPLPNDTPVNGTTPVPSTSTIHTPTTSTFASGPTFSTQQWRFCLSTLRQLKKLKDASPFLRPVDPVALNIPHYPSIIKTPMDFSTIDRKLNSSSPAKPDPNPSNPRYIHADEFVADVRLVFSNCVTFNGPDHAVSIMGKRVEETFDKTIKQMPPPLEVACEFLHDMWLLTSFIGQAPNQEASNTSSASSRPCVRCCRRRATKESHGPTPLNISPCYSPNRSR